ncbi:MAG TPA: hypothetical protein PLV12_09690, partial [Saprospiraceae bacterium]|nr:hypothetical protein [Saprospiraceae bacterium]
YLKHNAIYNDKNINSVYSLRIDANVVKLFERTTADQQGVCIVEGVKMVEMRGIIRKNGDERYKLTIVIDKKGELAVFLHDFKRIWQKYI